MEVYEDKKKEEKPLRGLPPDLEPDYDPTGPPGAREVEMDVNTSAAPATATSTTSSTPTTSAPDLTTATEGPAATATSNDTTNTSSAGQAEAQPPIDAAAAVTGFLADLDKTLLGGV